MGTEPSKEEGEDESRDRESWDEPSRGNRTGWLAIVNLLTQIAVLGGTIADVLSRI